VREVIDASARFPQRGPDDYLPNVPTVAAMGGDVQDLLWRGALTYANRGDMCINILTLYQSNDGAWRATIFIQTDTVSRVEDVSAHLVVLRPGAEAGLPSNASPRAWITNEFLSLIAIKRKPTPQDATVVYVCARFGVSRELARRLYVEVHATLLHEPPPRGRPQFAKK